MRITNQMINESARKAGLPIHYNSLLNHINKNSGNSLLDSLTKTNSSTNLSDVTNGINVNSTNIIKRNQYQKLGQVADKLMQNAEDFVGNGTSSIFAEAENSGNYEKVYQNTEKLTENYNAVIKALKSASTPLNDYYKQMLQEVITDEKDTLNTIGITLSKDGTMHLDKETLKTADKTQLEQILGANGSFSIKMGFIAERISNNAQTNIESLTSQYNARGSLALATITSGKYDFWG